MIQRDWVVGEIDFDGIASSMSAVQQ